MPSDVCDACLDGHHDRCGGCDCWHHRDPGGHVTVPDTPSAAVDAEVRDHVADIVFSSMEAPDPDCRLCQLAVEHGVWAQWGPADPFAEPSDD